MFAAFAQDFVPGQGYRSIIAEGYSSVPQNDRGWEGRVRPEPSVQAEVSAQVVSTAPAKAGVMDALTTVALFGGIGYLVYRFVKR